MQFNLKSLFAGVVIGTVMATSVSVIAFDGTTKIEATYKNIKVFINGAELTPRDSTGTIREPFISNGTTYLPLRAIGEAIGMNVNYDSNNNYIYLTSAGSSNSGGSSSIATPQGRTLEPYYTECSNVEDITMGGTRYKNSLIFWGNGGAVASFNLNGSYTTVNGLYGTTDESGYDGIVYFYGDDILLGSYDIEKGQLPKNFSFNVTGVSKLSIVMESPGIDFRGGIGNIMFK